MDEPGSQELFGAEFGVRNRGRRLADAGDTSGRRGPESVGTANAGGDEWSGRPNLRHRRRHADTTAPSSRILLVTPRLFVLVGCLFLGVTATIAGCAKSTSATAPSSVASPTSPPGVRVLRQSSTESPVGFKVTLSPVEASDHPALSAEVMEADFCSNRECPSGTPTDLLLAHIVDPASGLTPPGRLVWIVQYTDPCVSLGPDSSPSSTTCHYNDAYDANTGVYTSGWSGP
jgi:hypothetical protein